MTISRSDLEYRHLLDTNYKPYFDPYERSGGMPMATLRSMLLNSNIPHHKVTKFLTYADSNKDLRITYDEFITRFMSEDTNFQHRLVSRKVVLNKTVFAVCPQSAIAQQQKNMRKAGLDSTDTYNWGEANVNNYVEAYDCRPPPIFIPLITLSQICVFIYYAVLHGLDDNVNNDVTASSGVPMNSLLIYLPSKRYQCWRFYTYSFIHSGYMHLIFNVLLQLVLGTLLELVHKFWRVGIVYILGVLAGSFAHSISDPYAILVGASGGCYALIGAHTASVIMNWNTMQKGWLDNPLNCLSSAAVRLTLIILLAGSDTASAIYSRVVSPVASSSIGFTAHLGGFVTGILIGIPVLRNLQVEKWEKFCFWISLGLFTGFMILAILFNIFCEDMKWCPVTVW